MDAYHILLGRPWQLDKDMMHRGRSNKYDLRNNGKKIVLSPMSSSAVRSMGRKQTKKPNVIILASKKEVEHVLNQGE